MDVTNSADQYRAAMYRSLLNDDPRSRGVYNALMEVYPAFAKKIFQDNKLMEILVMRGGNPMLILNYPVCGKCETLALPHTPIKQNGKSIPRCGCVSDKCGAITKNPITFREWLVMELKNKVPKDSISVVMNSVDMIALSMMRKSALEMKRLEEAATVVNAKGVGIVNSSGNSIRS